MECIVCLTYPVRSSLSPSFLLFPLPFFSHLSLCPPPSLLLRLDLEAEVDMPKTLVHSGRRENVDIGPEMPGKGALDNTARRLNEELTLAAPLVLEPLGCCVEALALDVVEHDDVGAGRDRLVCLLVGLALDIYEQREAGDTADSLDCLGDGACVSVSR